MNAMDYRDLDVDELRENPSLIRPGITDSDATINRMISLVRCTGARLTLGQVHFLDPVDTLDAVEALSDVIGPRGLVNVAGNGDVLLLFVRFDSDDAMADRHALRVVATGLAQCDTIGEVRFQTLHRDAAEIADLDDLVAELAGFPALGH